MNEIAADICVIGAGSGGLSVAAGAAQLGLKVVLVEAHKMGGDCLNYGCVPSKALIAAASAVKAAREAARFGLQTAGGVDYAAVRNHVRATIASIAPMDSVERFEGLGVKVVAARAKFVGPKLVEAGDMRIAARKFVVATGSRAAVPPIPGLAEVPFLTNETVFELDRRPDHLVVIGAGPIGCELAQAHARLGTKVTLIEAASMLPKDDEEAVAVVRQSLIADGVALREQAKVKRIERHAVGTVVVLDDGKGGEAALACSHLLIATGRKANIEDLGLEAAGIASDGRAIKVDDRLRTSNRDVLALGDVAGGLQFTHVAGWHAGLAIRNLCFRIPARADTTAIPWVTYTAPELAQVGVSEAAAKATNRDIETARWPFHDNDRATATGETAGFVKLVAERGRVIGATIVGAHAGDLVAPWVVAVGQRLKVATMAGAVMPYPTLSEAGKRAAGAYFSPRLFSPRTRKLVRFLFDLPF
ncbi:MAG: FAD-dependent oxidoreductase [Telmatospirillum sp.]|nr:FAD-dependent oxidoreductase [Telmatospirillum sp.]